MSNEQSDPRVNVGQIPKSSFEPLFPEEESFALEGQELDPATALPAEILAKYHRNFHLLLGSLFDTLLQDLLVKKDDEKETKVRFADFLALLNKLVPYPTRLDPTDQFSQLPPHGKWTGRGMGEILEEKMMELAQQAKADLEESLRKGINFVAQVDGQLVEKNFGIDPAGVIWLAEVPFVSGWKTTQGLQIVVEDQELAQALAAKKITVHLQETQETLHPISIAQLAQIVVTQDDFILKIGTDGQEVNDEVRDNKNGFSIDLVSAQQQAAENLKGNSKEEITEHVEQLSLNKKLSILITALRGGYYNFDTFDIGKRSVVDFDRFIASLSARADLVGFFPIEENIANADTSDETGEKAQITVFLASLTKIFSNKDLLDFTTYNQVLSVTAQRLTELLQAGKVGFTLVEVKTSMFTENSDPEKKEKERQQKIRRHQKDLAHTIFAAFEFLVSLSRKTDPLGQKKEGISSFTTGIQEGIQAAGVGVEKTDVEAKSSSPWLGLMQASYECRQQVVASAEFRKLRRTMLALHNSCLILEVNTDWLEKAWRVEETENLETDELETKYIFGSYPVPERIIKDDNTAVELIRLERGKLIAFLRKKVDLARQVVFEFEMKNRIRIAYRELKQRYLHGVDFNFEKERAVFIKEMAKKYRVSAGVIKKWIPDLKEVEV